MKTTRGVDEEMASCSWQDPHKVSKLPAIFLPFNVVSNASLFFVMQTNNG